MTHLVIGFGQIGQAIYKVLAQKGEVDHIDKGESTPEEYDFIHICIPYTEEFNSLVGGFKGQYLKDDGVCVIHSTVPVGTSKKLGAVHSPVRGIHPNLYEGVMSFTKYFGGSQAEDAAWEFAERGVSVNCTPDSNAVEALKLWDTTQYGWNILLEKKIHEWCEENGVDFDLVYTDANLTYNQGYEKLGHPEYKKYILKHMEGPLGGHCVIPNCHILDHEIAKQILRENENLL